MKALRTVNCQYQQLTSKTAHVPCVRLGLFWADVPAVLLLGELKQLPTSDAVSVLVLLGPGEAEKSLRLNKETHSKCLPINIFS